MSKKWFTLGTLRGAYNDDDRPPYIVLDKNVEILVNGEKVELSKYRVVRLYDSRKSAEMLFEKDKIDKEEYEKKLDIIENKNIDFNLVVPPSEE